MLLLTWHGTVVCLRPEGGGLVHVPVAPPGEDAAPLDLELPAAVTWEPQRVATSLGTLHVQASAGGRGVCLARYGRFLCADPDIAEPAFDREEPSLWETFLPISAQDLADLRHILSHDWIDPRTRRVIRQRAIGLAPEFRLLVGAAAYDLAACLPMAPHDAAGAYRPPDALRLSGQGGGVELVRAAPGGSALVTTQAWPVRARQAAQAMALAAHRGVRGLEPEQEELDRDVAWLEQRGAAGLADLLDSLQHDPGSPRHAETGPDRAPEAGQPACQAVSLGLGCAAAWAIRRMGQTNPPMPFDWINATPAMVRHCIETDFAVLLDRSYYVSLTGKPGLNDPWNACAHTYYAGTFGVERVFYHNDPTRPAAYRYVEAGVDRFRDLLATPEPKLFVQVGRAAADAAEQFAATAMLLDGITRGAMLVQVAVRLPDRRLALPLLSLESVAGPHRLYALRPTSQLHGHGFERQVDQDFLAGLLAAHAARPASSPETARAERGRVSEAIARFGAANPDLDRERLTGSRSVTDLANDSLAAAARSIGLPERFRFGVFDSRSAANLGSETLAVEVGPQAVLLRVDAACRTPWMILTRALSLIILLDEVFVRTPVTHGRFLAEVGDAGMRADSLSFCSNRPANLLVPDPDFISSGGYEDQRALVLREARPWAERRRVAFWRGATTGRLRHEPPADGLPDDFTWLARLDMVYRARRSPHAAYYDVGITDFVQLARHEDLPARIAAAGLMRPRAPRAAFLECRAILVIDGNTNAWSALFCALLSGACVIKVGSEQGFRQWYHDRLKPWIHFVPVEPDLSDMDDVVAWVMQHEADAEAIGAAGKAMADSMTFEAEIDRAADSLVEWLGQRL